MKENLRISGHFIAIVRKYVSGVWIPIQKIEQKNQILNTLLDHFIQKVGNDTTDNITQLTFGTNTTAPTRTDTILTMQNAYNNALVGSATYPAYNKIKYTFALTTAENNGYNISEYALTLNTDEIVCRITRGIVEKSVNIRIDGTWELTIDI